MKTTKFFKFLFLTSLIVTLGLSSCVEPIDEPEVNNFEILTNYLKANNLDLNYMTIQWTIDASVVNQSPAAYYIIDLRSASDFAQGHIQGAVHSTLPNILTTAENAGTKPIVVVCYTGQTAAIGHVALRLSGYPNTRILKWGMSSWAPQLDRWSNNVSNRAMNHANWSATNTIVPSVNFNLPEFEAADTAAAAILRERVDIMLAKGFAAMSVSAEEVLNNPGNYFINNYWTAQNVADHGHIKGAYRINEELTLAADGFKKLNPNATIITYCWTGQTSTLVSAYLTVLGYPNAKSMSFGNNALINEILKANKWVEANIGDFPLVTSN
jgi:rhodanese-related sulfurtransferase